MWIRYIITKVVKTKFDWVTNRNILSKKKQFSTDCGCHFYNGRLRHTKLGWGWSAILRHKDGEGRPLGPLLPLVTRLQRFETSKILRWMSLDLQSFHWRIWGNQKLLGSSYDSANFEPLFIFLYLFILLYFSLAGSITLFLCLLPFHFTLILSRSLSHTHNLSLYLTSNLSINKFGHT